MHAITRTAAASALAVLTTTAFAQVTTQFVEDSKHHAHRIVCSQGGQTIHDVQDARDINLHRANGQLVRITYATTRTLLTPSFLEISPATTSCSVRRAGT